MAGERPIEADVVILGAGPAGCALALNLAPFARVLLIDKGREQARQVGESLPAAAARLLRDMGLEQAFLAQGHAPCFATRSTWGSAAPFEQDALRNLDGPGWHLDRTRFDAWLCGVAAERGAATIAPARLAGVRRLGGESGWELSLERLGKPLRVLARLLVDASGRAGSLARHVGARRAPDSKLVCGWLVGDAPGPPGIGELHAEVEGWWYSSPLPGGRRLLAFYTDADLPAALAARSGAALLKRLSATPQLNGTALADNFGADGRHGFCAAHGAVLEQTWGENWLAVGDAALAFDPLSAQGLFNALYTGLAAAEAAHRFLAGNGGALASYGAGLLQVRRTYARHLDAWYLEERRWSGSPFWKRRHEGATAL